MPYLDDAHADQFLTSISILQTNEGLIGDMIFPTAAADKRSGKYAVYGTEHFKATETARRPGSSAQEISFTRSTGFFNVQEHAQKVILTAQERQNVDSPPYDIMTDDTLQLTELMKLDRERTQMAVAADPTQITQNTALSGTSQWSDYTNSTPLTNIKAARQQVRAGIHREANMFTTSYDVALTIAEHPSIKDLLKYTDPNALAAGELPPVLRGLKVLVSQADSDSTGIGSATPTFAPIFSKAALIHYTAPSLTLRSISLGGTIEVPDPVTGQRSLSTRTWWDDDKKSWWIEVADTYQVKVFAALAGFLYVSAIA